MIENLGLNIVDHMTIKRAQECFNGKKNMIHLY